jgi:hypothetical protein
MFNHSSLQKVILLLQNITLLRPWHGAQRSDDVSYQVHGSMPNFPSCAFARRQAIVTALSWQPLIRTMLRAWGPSGEMLAGTKGSSDSRWPSSRCVHFCVSSLATHSCTRNLRRISDLDCLTISLSRFDQRLDTRRYSERGLHSVERKRLLILATSPAFLAHFLLAFQKILSFVERKSVDSLLDGPRA